MNLDVVKNAAVAALFASSAGCMTTSCISRGSRVRTPDGRRRIENLDIGDAILSVDPEAGELVAGEITHVESAERECLELVCGGDWTLTCTSDHPVYDPDRDEYAEAGEWFSGDRSALLAVSGDEIERREVTGRESFAGIREVFDLTVDNELHNFVADGILVHNKSYAFDCEYEGETRIDGSMCTCEDGRNGAIECPSHDPEGPEPEGTCNCFERDGGADADRGDGRSDGMSSRDTDSPDAEQQSDAADGGGDTSRVDGGDAADIDESDGTN